MGSSEGVCFVAFGQVYFDMTCRSLDSLRRYEPSLPAIILTDKETKPTEEISDKNLEVVRLDLDREQNRSVKTRLPDYIPFERSLFLDSDTVVIRPVRPIFRHLEAFDLCAAFCGLTLNGHVRHLLPEEKKAILEVCPWDSLHFQSGVMAWRRCPETLEFFRQWHREWLRFKKHDQGAMALAVWRSRLRVGVLWRDEWNLLKTNPAVTARVWHYAMKKKHGLGDVWPDTPTSVDGETGGESEEEERFRAEDEETSYTETGGADAEAGDANAESTDSEESGETTDLQCPVPDSAGVCYVAFGEERFEQVCASIASLREHEPDLPVTVLTDRARVLPEIPETAPVEVREVAGEDAEGVTVRLTLPSHVEYEHCLVLHPDTEIMQPIASAFAYLDAFDLGVTCDCRGILREARYLSPEERLETFRVCTDSSLLYETGVMVWRRCESVLEFHRTWHDEWRKFGGHVEGAFSRALWKSSVRVGVLWPDIWNGVWRNRNLRIRRPKDSLMHGSVPRVRPRAE